MTNVALYLLVLLTLSAASAWWWRQTRPPDPFDSGFGVEVMDGLAILVMHGAAPLPLTIFLLLIRLGRIRSRLAAILWSPLVGLPPFLVFLQTLPTSALGWISGISASLVTGLVYSAVIRLHETRVPRIVERPPIPASAIAALFLGIAGIFVVTGILGVPAVILGKRAIARIREDPTLEGEDLAKAGVVLGWIGIGVALFGLLPWLFFGAMVLWR